MSTNKYNKYRLSYPIQGNKIYQSISLNRAAHKCYKDFKKLNGDGGLFYVENIDTHEIFKYRTKDKHTQKGGNNDLYYKIKNKWILQK